MKVKIAKYCSCGERLETTADDEQDAINKVQAFYRKHTGIEPDGTEHKRVKPGHYWSILARKKREAQAAAQKQMAEMTATAPKSRTYKIRRVIL